VTEIQVYILLLKLTQELNEKTNILLDLESRSEL
jgi:hypothetical protein